MEVFFFCLIVFLAVINLILAISTSLVLIKIFEIVKEVQVNQDLEFKARQQALDRVKGLMDVETPQAQYILRR
jgi:hypothetical protein